MSLVCLFHRKFLIGLGSTLFCFLLASGVVAQETGELRGQVTTTGVSTSGLKETVIGPVRKAKKQ